MNDTESIALADRWPQALRAGGHGAVADVLEDWFAGEAGALPATARALRAEVPLGDAARAFALLGGRMRAAGLGADDLDAALGAFDVALRDDAGAPREARTDPSGGTTASGDVAAVSGVRGLIAGAWHLEAGGGGTPPGPGGAGAPLAGLDPALGKILRHDIKTPLQAASLNLELLAMEQEGNAAVTDAISTIMASLDSAVEMLQRFDEV